MREEGTATPKGDGGVGKEQQQHQGTNIMIETSEVGQ